MAILLRDQGIFKPVQGIQLRDQGVWKPVQRQLVYSDESYVAPTLAMIGSTTATTEVLPLPDVPVGTFMLVFLGTTAQVNWTPDLGEPTMPAGWTAGRANFTAGSFGNRRVSAWWRRKELGDPSDVTIVNPTGGSGFTRYTFATATCMAWQGAGGIGVSVGGGNAGNASSMTIPEMTGLRTDSYVAFAVASTNMTNATGAMTVRLDGGQVAHSAAVVGSTSIGTTTVTYSGNTITIALAVEILQEPSIVPGWKQVFLRSAPSFSFSGTFASDMDGWYSAAPWGRTTTSAAVRTSPGGMQSPASVVTGSDTLQIANSLNFDLPPVYGLRVVFKCWHKRASGSSGTYRTFAQIGGQTEPLPPQETLSINPTTAWSEYMAYRDFPPNYTSSIAMRLCNERSGTIRLYYDDWSIEGFPIPY